MKHCAGHARMANRIILETLNRNYARARLHQNQTTVCPTAVNQTGPAAINQPKVHRFEIQQIKLARPIITQ